MMKTTSENQQARRTFIKQSVAGLGALTVALYLPQPATSQTRSATMSGALKPNAWVEVPEIGRIRFICGRSEMGQGSSTGLAQLLCEELEYPLDELDLMIAPANRQYDHRDYFLQTTGGSSSIRTEFKTMLQAGACVRELFKNAAAQKWNVAAQDITVTGGKFFHAATGKSASYNELVESARDLPIPNIKPREAAQFRVVGKRVPRIDNLVKITGKPIFGIDAQPEELVNAWVQHGPTFDASPKSCNEAEISKMLGVLQVVFTTRGIAIVAKKYWQAKAAGEKLIAQWNVPSVAFSSASYATRCVDASKDFSGRSIANQGSLTIDSAPTAVIDAVYEVPFLAHATMEPQNCTVRLSDQSCEVWVPTQSPGLVVPAVKKLTGLPANRITVNCTYMGGGFGRRLEADYIAEAIEIAKAYKGKEAVKMLWSREADMQAGMYRPHAVSRVRGSYNKQAQNIQWEQVIVTPAIMDRQGPDFMTGIAPHWVGDSAARGVGGIVSWFIDGLTVKEGAAPPYQTQGLKVTWQKTKTPVPVASWRSVGHSHNAFFTECFADELAHSQKQDPVEFRQVMLAANQTRLKASLEAVTQSCQWKNDANQGAPKGRFRGVATHECFKGFAAMVIEISVADNSGKGLQIHNVWCAIDCGIPVNLDGVLQQIEGSVIFGLSAALYGEITIEKGVVQQSNFHDYPLLRSNEAPTVHVTVIPSTEPPGGVGEPAVPLVAPALANAIFAATGKRLRKLPLDLG